MSAPLIASNDGNRIPPLGLDNLQVIYAHESGGLESDYYGAFFPIHRNPFDTRDRANHARKCEIGSHILSLKSALELEPCIQLHIGGLLRQWDRLAEGRKKDLSGEEGGGLFRRDGSVWYNCHPWYNYLVFDITGDFVFGMLKATKDIVPAARSRDDTSGQGSP